MLLIPKALASVVYSGLLFRTAMYRSSWKRRCQYSTIICDSLSRMSSLTGIFSSPMVLSSVKVMLKDPSPSTEMHILLGLASLAPMQYPSETPMVPREPEESIWRGCVHVMSCAAAIWWMPTPVEKMALSIFPDSRSCWFISWMTRWVHILDLITTSSVPSSFWMVYFSGGYLVILIGYSSSSLCFLSIHSFVLRVSLGGSALIALFTAVRNFFPVE
mmetsp:Transcript_201/g.465  ORF Transcript_201/g.465 Transcript_201/m.465 type:complete len:217 (-) Transcript_201:83-733(-)